MEALKPRTPWNLAWVFTSLQDLNGLSLHLSPFQRNGWEGLCILLTRMFWRLLDLSHSHADLCWCPWEQGAGSTASAVFVYQGCWLRGAVGRLIFILIQTREDDTKTWKTRICNCLGARPQDTERRLMAFLHRLWDIYSHKQYVLYKENILC